MSLLLSEGLISSFTSHLSLELKAHQTYSAFANYCSLLSVAYPGFAKFFRSEADEEWSHSRKFMDFITRRGNNFSMPHIDEVSVKDDTSMLDLLSQAMKLELDVLGSMKSLHGKAEEEHDVDSAVFLEDFIQEQTQAVAELQSRITIVSRFGYDNHGIYHYDQELLD